MARANDESDDEGLAIALGMGVGMKFARGDGGGEDDRGADGVPAAMDRLGSGARAKARRDEALIAEARALGRAEEEDEEDEEDEDEAPRELALAEAANAQGSRALQILKMNPEVRNAVAEQMFLPAIHKSLAPKIRTEMKTSLFRPKLPAWAQTKKEHLEITGSLEEVQRALDANQKFQLDVRAMLESIDDKLAKNEMLLAEVTRCKNRKGRRLHWSLQESMYELWGQRSELYFRVPSAWTLSQRSNSLNEEDGNGLVSQAKLQKQITPNADQLRLGWPNLVDKIPLCYTTYCRTWTPKDDEQLQKGVHFQLQKARLVTDQRMSLEELAGVSLQSLSTLLVPGGLDVIARDAEAIDWSEVVRMHMPVRTVDDCRLRWMNVVDPRISTAEWTEEEDDKLIELVKENQERLDWSVVAEEIYASNLTTDRLVRTPHQCAVRYQAEWNPSLVRSTWTAEEDAFILKWTREHGAGQWVKLARLLPGHTGQQLLHRWRRLQPTRRVGAWTEEEDEALRVAIGAYTSGERIKWSLVAARIPSRTDVQCRERWKNVLDPKIKFGPWSAEEDAALISALGPALETTEFNEWSRLTELCPGRTPKNCMRRVRALGRKLKKDAEIAKKRAALAQKRADDKTNAAKAKAEAAAAAAAAAAAQSAPQSAPQAEAPPEPPTKPEPKRRRTRATR